MEALIYKTNLVCSDTCISLHRTASLLWKRKPCKKNSTHPPTVLKFLSSQQLLSNHYTAQINEQLLCAHKFRKTAPVILGHFPADIQCRAQQKRLLRILTIHIVAWNSNSKGTNCNYRRRTPEQEVWTNRTETIYPHSIPPMFLVKFSQKM